MRVSHSDDRHVGHRLWKRSSSLDTLCVRRGLHMDYWLDFVTYSEGLRACLRGEPQSACPHPFSSDPHALWCEGWMDGCKLSRDHAAKRSRERLH